MKLSPIWSFVIITIISATASIFALRNSWYDKKHRNSIEANNSRAYSTLTWMNEKQRKFKEGHGSYSSLKNLIDSDIVSSDYLLIMTGKSKYHGFFYRFITTGDEWKITAIPAEPGISGSKSYYMENNGRIIVAPVKTPVRKEPPGPQVYEVFIFALVGGIVIYSVIEGLRRILAWVFKSKLKGYIAKEFPKTLFVVTIVALIPVFTSIPLYILGVFAERIPNFRRIPLAQLWCLTLFVLFPSLYISYMIAVQLLQFEDAVWTVLLSFTGVGLPVGILFSKMKKNKGFAILPIIFPAYILWFFFCIIHLFAD